MNPIFIVYSFLKKISTKWSAHSFASSSKQDMFTKNLMQTVIQTFYIFFIFW